MWESKSWMSAKEGKREREREKKEKVGKKGVKMHAWIVEWTNVSMLNHKPISQIWPSFILTVNQVALYPLKTIKATVNLISNNIY